MHRTAICRLLLMLLSVFPGKLRGQTSAAPTCGDSLRKAVAFLQGNWEGRSLSIAGGDTTLDALMTVSSRPLYGSCALEERWVAEKGGRALFNAKVLRAYDSATRRWSVFYVDDQLNSQVYEGRQEGGQWRFYRSRLDNGVPIQVRLTWRPTKDGYDQLIERSRDAGATWTLGGLVIYKALAPGSR